MIFRIWTVASKLLSINIQISCNIRHLLLAFFFIYLLEKRKEKIAQTKLIGQILKKYK